MEEVEYSITTKKPFVCVLLDDILVPPLLKGEEEKLHFIHNENMDMKEIQNFIYKLEGMNFEKINSKLNIAEESLANQFVKHLKEKDVNMRILLNDKSFNILDALTTRKECKLAPVDIVNYNLGGNEINASYYKSTIAQLKYFDLIETQDSGDNVIALKIQNSEFQHSIIEAKTRYGKYWKNYFKDAIKLELYE